MSEKKALRMMEVARRVLPGESENRLIHLCKKARDEGIGFRHSKGPGGAPAMLWKKDVKRFADALRRLNATSIRHGLGPQDSVTPDLFSDLAEELDRAATVSPEEPGSHLENMTFDHSDGEVAELRKRLEAKDKALREFFEQAEEIGFKPRISATLIRDGAFA